MYKIILWDVDNTLLNFDKSMIYSLQKSFAHFHIPISDEVITKYEEINNSYWKKLEIGQVTKEQLLIGRFEELIHYFNLEKQLTAKQIQPIYQEALGSVYYYIDDSLSLCKKLKSKVRQFAVTNGVTSTQLSKLRLSGLDQCMEQLFISEQIGYNKPDKAFFENCFKKIPDFERSDTLIVGDSLTSDILGGNISGISCCWYNPTHSLIPASDKMSKLRIDYEITNLWEVEEILNAKII